ncbi:hypothetical protein [Photobacterium damselae]|uniref:hypothetical protein n=1 Tax=Photobacterium damselae TaxID=38293 RepID=UPI004067B7B4
MTEKVYSLSDTQWKESFNSIDELIKHAVSEEIIDVEHPQFSIYVGEKVPSTAKEYVDSSNFISSIHRIACKQQRIGSVEHLSDINKNKIANLRDRVVDWLESNELTPKLFNIVNVKPIRIENIHDYL